MRCTLHTHTTHCSLLLTMGVFVFILELFMIVLFFQQRCQAVDSQWIVEIGLLSYSNVMSKAIENFSQNSCCDGSINEGDEDEEDCTNDCDNFFIFCLQKLTEIGIKSCSYGLYTTNEVGGDNLSFEIGTTIDNTTPNPLVFTGNNWPDNGVVRFVVYTYDNDSVLVNSKRDDLVDIATTDIAVDNSTNKQITLNGMYNQLLIEYSTRCAMNYYGLQCNVRCVPMNDDTSGHYTCDSQGNIQCLSGYMDTGTNCTTVIPSCDTVHCNINSYCNNSTIMCQCINGWIGDDCTIPVCMEECQNDGLCVQPNKCQCINGWIGDDCTIAILVENCTRDNCSQDSSSHTHLFLSASSVTIQSTNTLSNAIDNSSTDYRLLIGSVFGAVFIFVIAVIILIIIIILVIINRNHKISKNKTIATSTAVVACNRDTIDGPGDNPNYSSTLLGSQPNLVAHNNNNNPLNTLDNPLYNTKSNSCVNIISGYSLVSIAEDETVYYSSADRRTNHDSFLCDSIRKPTTVFLPAYYSQPVLNDTNDDRIAEYDYVDATSCINLAKDKKK